MAILSGFPPSNTISPSVRITEIDNSFIATAPQTSAAGVVGFASKGPINIPTIINTRAQLNTVFGYPHPESGDPYLIYAGMQYLNVANTLYVVRVADDATVSDEAAQLASVNVPSAGSIIQIIASCAGSYVFAVDSFFSWKLNGILASKALVVLAGSYSTDDLVTDLNNQLNAEFDGIQFYNSPGDFLGLETIWAFGPDASLELISIQDSIYGPGSVCCMGTSMTVAETIGVNDRYPNNAYQTGGTYDFTGLTGLNIQIVVSGSNNVNIDNIIQVIDLSDLEGMSNTLGQIITEINSQRAGFGGTLPGGWQALAVGNQLAFETLTSGRDAQLLIKSDSTSNTIFGFTNVTAVGTSPAGTSGSVAIATFGIVNGAANLTGQVTFTVTADTPGIDGNATQIVITNNIAEGNFNIQVYNNGGQVEAWGALVKDPTSSYYVESFIALVSDWISVIDNTAVTGPPLDGTYSLSGGTDGIPSDPDAQDALIIGQSASFTGIYSLSDPEQIDIDLFIVPGHASTAVVAAMLDMCQNFRQDCLAIIDPPFGLTVHEIVQWQNGTHPLNTTRFDSDFGALYWPWLKYTDVFNLIDVWVPPSGSVIATIARSDQVSAPWFAPAGVTRGVVNGITDVFTRPSLAERDSMYGNRNAVNPIISFPDIGGFLIFGQKTLQRTPSALDRINVRRMMFYIEKQIRVSARRLLFEPNDQTLWTQFIQLASAICNAVMIGRGMYAFVVKCDATLNTPDVIDRNEMHAQIGVQPTIAAEFIFIEFSINRTGDFSLPSSSTF